MSTTEQPLTIRVLEHASASVDVLLEEFRQVVAEQEQPLISFATGATYTRMLEGLAQQMDEGRVDWRAFHATHLDEYLHYPVDRVGGMVHELVAACPPLQQMVEQGSFVPVPHDGSLDALVDHQQALADLGGVRLQLLGIGRNGHLAFNEPGTALDSTFHVTRLSAVTRRDAQARFGEEAVPERAASAGLASIMAADRLVLCAFGENKAPAVAAMLEGEVGPDCPASVLRRHPNVVVLLDRPACRDLRETPVAQAT